MAREDLRISKKDLRTLLDKLSAGADLRNEIAKAELEIAKTELEIAKAEVEIATIDGKDATTLWELETIRKSHVQTMLTLMEYANSLTKSLIPVTNGKNFTRS